MKNSDLKLQTLKIVSGQEVETSHRPIVEDFLKYIHAYCAELKVTEHDILGDDEHFDRVVDIYSGIKKK